MEPRPSEQGTGRLPEATPRVARTPTIRWPSGPAAVQVNRTAAERVSGTAAVRVSGTAAVRDGPAHVGYAASWRHGRAREPAHRYALRRADRCPGPHRLAAQDTGLSRRRHGFESRWGRSEEHTSELQSRGHLVCRLLLEKKKA